jgi:hypothetical protein
MIPEIGTRETVAENGDEIMRGTKSWTVHMALTIVWTPMIEILARAEDGVSTVTT